MQERRVTVMGQSHPLPDPFFVLATQNPIELEGTYPLPEAQLDRFLFKLEVHRNGVDVLERIVQHRQIGDRTRRGTRALARGTAGAGRPGGADFPAGRRRQLHRAARGRDPRRVSRRRRAGIKFGASPRAALGLAAAARARALLAGRLNASFEDVQAVAVPVLQHRIVLDYHARIDGLTAPEVVRALLEEVPAQVQAVPSTLRAAKL